MGVIGKLKRAVRGEISPQTALLEVARRSGASFIRWRDLARLNENAKLPAKLKPDFAGMPPSKLVTHFRSRRSPYLFYESSWFAETHLRLFPSETKQLIQLANRICDEHRWPLLGFGEKHFGDEIQWRRDPLSGYEWPLDYHRNVKLIREDGSDARVTWELNRLGHLLKLACAYRITNDEKLASEFFRQLRHWHEQNPYGRGVNWSCAMEVALRAVNLIACFEIFRQSKQLNELSLSLFLDLMYQHGLYIRRNLEFSYIATSNHYLSDVVGLLWIGVMFPELADAENWRDFGLRETLREMDKQVLDDGCDFEASTGYHRLALELFLYSFMLCRRNGIEISEHYWQKLQAMLNYTRNYLRPDGLAPLIGDSDSGQFLPLVKRRADDHAYVLAIGAVVCNEPQMKVTPFIPPELLWLCGEEGVASFEQLETSAQPSSTAFQSGGTYVMRHDDMFLCFNASGPGIGGRGSHGHNDALSIEVCIGERAFIVDPGTYVYSADLQKRHQFRSTAYHSTIEVDGIDQNTTQLDQPFIIGREGAPEVLVWETSAAVDRVSAVHNGYGRLPSPVTHKRTVTFNKSELHWLVQDDLGGDGEHEFRIRFHFDAGLEVIAGGSSVTANDVSSGVKLTITAETLQVPPLLEEQAVSRDYGSMSPSVTACWTIVGKPTKLTWKVSTTSP